MPTPYQPMGPQPMGAAGGPAIPEPRFEGEGQRFPPGQPGAVGPQLIPNMAGQKAPMPGPPGQVAPANFPSSVQAVVSMQQRNNRIAPVSKPQGLNPLTLLQERENRYAEHTCTHSLSHPFNLREALVSTI